MVPFFPLSPLAYLFPHFSRIPAVKHSVENASCRAHSQKKLFTERLGLLYILYIGLYMSIRQQMLAGNV